MLQSRRNKDTDKSPSSEAHWRGADTVTANENSFSHALMKFLTHNANWSQTGTTHTQILQFAESSGKVRIQLNDTRMAANVLIALYSLVVVCSVVRLEVLLFSEETLLVTYETDLRTCWGDCVREASSV